MIIAAALILSTARVARRGGADADRLLRSAAGSQRRAEFVQDGSAFADLIRIRL